jgi:hypothetical protein
VFETLLKLFKCKKERKTHLRNVLPSGGCFFNLFDL